MLRSKITSLEFFSAEELFKVTPHIVADIDIVVAFVSLQLETLNVPIVDYLGHLGVCKVDVVASNASEKFPFFGPILPLSELPVLSVYKDGHDSLPAGVCEVGDTIVDVESHSFVRNLPGDLNHGRGSKR